jgi:hypothetical protein
LLAPRIRLTALLRPKGQPTPSGGKRGRLEAIYPRSVFAGLGLVKESRKLIKLIYMSIRMI